MINDLHSNQINVKNFDLNPTLAQQPPASKSMMVQKRPSAIGSGIGGGLKRPTMLKPPTQTNDTGHGITGSKINNGQSRVGVSPKKPGALGRGSSPTKQGGSRLQQQKPQAANSERNLLNKNHSN